MLDETEGPRDVSQLPDAGVAESDTATPRWQSSGLGRPFFYQESHLYRPQHAAHSPHLCHLDSTVAVLL